MHRTAATSEQQLLCWSPVGPASSSGAPVNRKRERHMRVAWEISVSPRASLGISSPLCLPHMSLRNVQAHRRTNGHRWSRQTDGKLVIEKRNGSQREGEVKDSKEKWHREEKASSLVTLRGLLVYHCMPKGIIWHPCPTMPSSSYVVLPGGPLPTSQEALLC